MLQVIRAPKQESLWATIKYLAKPASDWGPAIEKHRAIAPQGTSQKESGGLHLLCKLIDLTVTVKLIRLPGNSSR